MKLRNKKTGEVVPASNISVGIGKDGLWFDNLFELNEQFEDYIPQEPRLKDHVKRKLLRKWADKNCITEVNVTMPTYDNAILSFSWGMLAIEFIDDEEDLIDGATYTITKLCGEEEC